MARPNKSSTRPARFHREAAEVLSSLRESVAGLLTALPAIEKPADLHKAFGLDWTLSWQLFQVANLAAEDVPVLVAGPMVPSRTSLKKFAGRAAANGAAKARIDKLWRDYERFEALIQTHAGSRTTFNSMLAPAADARADLQHLRNAFRAAAHMLGFQARAKHICHIFTQRPGSDSWDFVVVSGFVDLRMTRPHPRVLVYRGRLTERAARDKARRRALGDISDPGGGYLLSEFSSSPLPAMECRELDAGWLVNELVNPDVGNLGAATLRFGVGYTDHPIPAGEDNVYTCDVAVDKPIEALYNDVLVQPGLMRGAAPSGELFLGNTHADTLTLPGEKISLSVPGIARLGNGPDVLAAADLPEYPALLRSVAAGFGTNVSGFEAYRLRVAFPMYQATARITWRLPR